MLFSSGFQDQLLVVQNQKQIPGKSTLEIKQATTPDEGFYFCVADNGISTIKTNGIVITVCGKTFRKNFICNICIKRIKFPNKFKNTGKCLFIYTCMFTSVHT